MKINVLLLCIVLASAIQCKKNTKGSDSMGSVANGDGVNVYPDKELMRFVDSVAACDPARWRKELSFYPDSIYNSQASVNKELSLTDFEGLKRSCREKKIKLSLLTKLFPGERIDTIRIEKGYFPLGVYSFSESGLEQFAVEVYEDGWTSRLYFFDKNRLIGKHSVFHKYGLELEHFKAGDGEWVVYYKQNLVSGSGIWWWNALFFKYSNGMLLPVLDELQSANLRDYSGRRSYRFEARLLKTNPLTMKMVYSDEFPDPATGAPIEILNDSTEVVYAWSDGQKQYVADFTGSTLNRDKIISYYEGENALLFIYSHKNLLKNLMGDADSLKRKAVRAYLSEAKSNYAKAGKR